MLAEKIKTAHGAHRAHLPTTCGDTGDGAHHARLALPSSHELASCAPRTSPVLRLTATASPRAREVRQQGVATHSAVDASKLVGRVACRDYATLDLNAVPRPSARVLGSRLAEAGLAPPSRAAHARAQASATTRDRSSNVDLAGPRSEHARHRRIRRPLQTRCKRGGRRVDASWQRGR